MVIKLSSAEKKTLQSVDPKGSGPKPWQTAREVGGGVFRKKPENLTQEEIRVVRNSFRKLVREALVEMNPADRGQYRISDRGRKLLGAGMPEFEGRFQRGEATEASKVAGKERMKQRPRKEKKSKSVKAAPKKSKSAKKAAPKKAKSAKKAAPKKSKAAPKKATPKKAKAPKIEVEDKSKATETKAAGNNGTEHKKPKFKRRQALKVANAKNADAGN
jgi:hypothetical protein